MIAVDPEPCPETLGMKWEIIVAHVFTLSFTLMGNLVYLIHLPACFLTVGVNKRLKRNVIYKD